MSIAAFKKRRELSLVLILMAIGAVLRLWSVHRLGLEHFDEGIYALSGLWAVVPGGLDPMVIPYAPPGFSILVGLSYRLTFPWPGVSGLSAIAPSLLCGIATIPVAAWLGRRTFGMGAGAAAAAFAALSGPHVAFSRMALTDVPFLLAWLIAMGLGMRFLERPGLGRAVALGIAVGLAQNLKYNGWLTGVIVGLAAIIGLAAVRENRRPAALARTFGWGLLAAGIAALLYLPWFLFVERHGGYASLVEHHRSYLGGPAMWWPHWNLQMAQSVALAGLVSGQMTWAGIAWALAWLGAAVAVGRVSTADDRWSGLRFRVGLLGGTAALGLLPNLPWWIALGLLPWFLRDAHPAVRLLGVWWLAMAILTPFYHPYARLWLPLHAAGWIVMAGWVSRLIVGPEAGAEADATTIVERPRWRGRLIIIGLALLLAIGQRFGHTETAQPLPGLLAPSDSLRTIAAHWNDPTFSPSPSPASLRILARPAVRFYYLTTGTPRWPLYVEPDWEQLRRNVTARDWVIIDEILLHQEPPDSVGHRVLQDLFEFASGEPDHLSGPTLLDIDPGAVYGHSSLGRKPGYSNDWRGGMPHRQDQTPSARVWLLDGDDVKTWIAP